MVEGTQRNLADNKQEGLTSSPEGHGLEKADTKLLSGTGSQKDSGRGGTKELPGWAWPWPKKRRHWPTFYISSSQAPNPSPIARQKAGLGSGEGHPDPEGEQDGLQVKW